VPHSTTSKHYARIVARRRRCADLIFAGNKMLANAAYAAEDGAKRFSKQAEQTILGLADRTHGRPGSSRCARSRPRARGCSSGPTPKQRISGVPTGFADLDNLTRGLQPGTLVVSARGRGWGRPASP
jgi:replicative DNA helicase